MSTQSVSALADVPEARYWTRASLGGGAGPEIIDAPIGDDLLTLRAWAATVQDPEQAWTKGLLALPAIESLAGRVLDELANGSGVARVGAPTVQGTAPSAPLLRLGYLALGGELGSVLGNYGRLYDVADRGVSHLEEAVPVSMTRAATGMHTDSSSAKVEPDWVGLLCLRPSPEGGLSRITSAASVHRRLVESHPDLAARLEREYIRDVVTPGVERSQAGLRGNAIPVFSGDQGLTFRYMRLWIETGAAAAGEELQVIDIDAFDTLDRLLHDPELMVEFPLAAGEQLWIANRTIAHDRTAYVDDPAAPRLLVRQWVQRA